MQPDTNLLFKAQQEAWHRGNLSWKLHAAQKAINETFKLFNSPLFVGNCSRQFGKSYWAVCKAVEQALKKSKSQIRYGAAFQSDLVEFIIPAFEKVLEGCPASIKPKYKKSGSRFVFPNGSIIKLIGLDKNPNGLRGNTLDLIILDECGFVSGLDYIYKSIIIPSTTHRPDARIILISTPPSTPAHPFMDYVQKAEVENGYAIFTIFDNPMLGAKDILRLMKETGCSIPNELEPIPVIENILKTRNIMFPESWKLSTTFRREYLCEFVTDSDLAIIPEWKDEYVQEVQTDEFYNYYHKYVGMDLGVKDFTAAIFGYYHFKKAALVIEDEVVLKGPELTTVLLKNAILDKESSLWKEVKPYRRISDNNNLMLIQDLATLHQLHFIPTNKDTLEAMINEVRLMVQEGKIIINPRCKLTIGSLKYGVWDSKRSQFARSKVYGHFDCLAALIYLVRNLNKFTNPIPSTYGTNKFTHYTPPQEQQQHEQIKKIFKRKQPNL